MGQLLRGKDSTRASSNGFGPRAPSLSASSQRPSIVNSSQAFIEMKAP